LASALVGAYRTDADIPAYFDLSNAFRAHQWNSLVNAYWFPFFPALLSLGRSLSGYRPQYEWMSARLVSAMTRISFIGASVVLAACARRLMLARGVEAGRLLPSRILYLWAATFSFFFASQDLTWLKPDALLCTFLVLTVAALLLAIAENSLLAYVGVGFCGALAYWAKSFAFAFFFMWMFLAFVANIRRPRVLRGLGLSVFVFALIAGPYIWQISALKGRFTFGESGRLDLAWYVNGADRFNPVSNSAGWQAGSARANLKHPGELLSSNPYIVYFGGDKVYGSTPQWDDPSYWSDGLAPRFVLRETLTVLKISTAMIAAFVLMRMQVLVLVFALPLWGFRPRRASLVDPILPLTLLQALGSILLYALVVVDGRFIAFAFVMAGVVYAACSLTVGRSESLRSLSNATLLMAALLLVFDGQNTLREWKTSQQQGARPLQGIYSLAVSSAAADLAAHFPPGAEVGCMGDVACWADPSWAHSARLKMTTIIETGNGVELKSAEQGCSRLAANPAALDSLRQRHVRAIVAKFDGKVPCSVDWRRLGNSADYFYLPL
jgi:hypothetical protein